MRVLVISAAFPPMHLGEATNTFYLCKHLADRKLDVHVLTSQSNTGTGDPRITVHTIMQHWSWLELPRFRRFLKRCAPDAILLMYIGLMYKFHPMITFSPTISKTILPRVPFVTRYESAFVGADPSKTSLIARVFRKILVRWLGRADITYSSGTLLRDSDQIIALCERHRSMLIEEWPQVRSKVSLIPPPPNMRICTDDSDVARLKGRDKLGVTPNDFVIAFLGYIYPVKGVETLLEAFQIVTRQRRQVKLLFIGGKNDVDVEVTSSYLNKIHTLSRELGVDQKTIWTGTFSPETDEASLYLYASDVCVLPFLQGVQLNNSSLSSVAAHGLPIIATRGPMLDEPFIHGENLLLCEPQAPKQLAECIMLLMDNASLRERLRAGVRKLALEWFSWDTAMARTLATFGAATGDVGSQRHGESYAHEPRTTG